VLRRFVSGGFSIGAHSFKDGGTTSPNFVVSVPDREPDFVVEEHVSEKQAHIYRLSADYNPLHIDPEFPGVAGGGFRAPILHGLCTMGHTIRQVFKQYCGDDASKFKACAVRFSSPVIPGETLVTKMWHEAGSDRIIFIAEVKETGKQCIANAFLDMEPSPKL
jgi:acyl dehydratase